MARKKAKKKAAGKPAKRKTKETLIVGSKAKAAIKAAGCNSSGDALETLNEVVHWYIEQAAARADSNGRKTVRGHDFLAGC